MTAFTFDLQRTKDALIRAASRKVRVEVFVYMQHTVSGTTLGIVERMRELKEAGV